MNKGLLWIACSALLSANCLQTHAQTGIGTLSPDASAMLDVTSSSKGVLVSRMTTSQRTAVASPANGLLVFDTDTQTFWFFKTGSGWTQISNGPITLPYNTTENNPATLFSIANNGDGTSLEGINNTTTSSIASIRGIVNSTAPGGFSSGVRGINNGTSGLGIGVWGSQNGSGWGVYGSTPNGLGVYGNASGSGTGVYANSTSGTGFTATSVNGIPASISVFNNSNNNNVLNVNSVGNGTLINASTTGSGDGVLSSTTTGFGVHGITSSQTSAGIVGDNNGGGEAVVGRTTSGIAGAVVGRNDGGGYGVHGFVATDTTGTGIGVYGRVGLSNSKGRAGRFENFGSTNTLGNTLEAYTIGNGNIPDNTQGNAASFKVNNTNSVAAGLRSEVNTIFGNFGAAGIFGISSGTGGFGGLFYASNTNGNGNALVALTDGNGDAIQANAGKNGDGVETNIDGNGRALYAWVPSFSDSGRAAEFRHLSADNDFPVVSSQTIGNGDAGYFKVNNTQGTSAGMHGVVNSIFANFGTAAIYGENIGTGGTAGTFYNSSTTTPRPAVIALTEGTGEGLIASANDGNGVESSVDGSGIAVYGYTPNFATGTAARFTNFNTSNGTNTLFVENYGTGTAMRAWHRGASGNIAVFQSGTTATNVARIDKTGKGFFNGGTQNSGADLAEAFDVTEEITEYEPGDVLSIAADKDRTVEKSAEAYSSLVLGVYATKPGVLLTEEHVDSDLKGKVPMGVVGVIPTKVCLEGGTIKRGDLLVTSSIRGVAMKADPKKVQPGQIIGKALQNCTAEGISKINVFVNIK